MTDIMHVTARATWAKALLEAESRSNTLATEGILHYCLPGRLAGGRLLLRGRTNLVVVRVASDKPKTPLKLENPPGSDEAFPHVYRPLNLGSLVEVLSPGGVLGG